MFDAETIETNSSLPQFPKLKTITEERFESLVERLMDKADSVFINSNITQIEYDAWIRRLHNWESNLKII